MYCKKCGIQVEPGAEYCKNCVNNTNAPFVQPQTYAAGPNYYSNGAVSYFDGGLLSYIGWSLLGGLITAVTFGICYPWALCMIYGWKINHTVIEGRRLKFTGSAVSLFGHWLLWLFLCIITLGIYSFWLRIELEKWKVKNTTFVN